MVLRAGRRIEPCLTFRWRKRICSGFGLLCRTILLCVKPVNQGLTQGV